MENHIPYGITQCYLLPSSSDFPAFTPAEDDTRFSDPGWMQGSVALGRGYTLNDDIMQMSQYAVYLHKHFQHEASDNTPQFSTISTAFTMQLCVNITSLLSPQSTCVFRL